MATQRRGNSSESPQRPPATTPDARENQLVSLAVDLAEKQIREGTASSQVISHYLKLGSSRERLEQERIKGEVLLQIAKAEAMASAKRMEELYENAINSMREYAGGGPIEPPEVYDD